VLEALPIVPLARLLAGRRLARVPVVLCVDIEPDDRSTDSGAKPWRGFERIARELVPPLRKQLSEETGTAAAFSWALRMDEQIARTWGSPTWAAEEYREDLDALVAEGDAINLHVHPWRLDEETDEWVVDHRPDWSARCVSNALDAYEEAFGRPAEAFRSGDGALNSAMLGVLAERGVAVDSTLEHGPTQWKPFTGERVYGDPFDSWRVPTRPYRSSPTAFPEPDPAGGADPLLMPLLGGPAKRGPWAGTLVPGTHPTLFAIRLLGTLLRRKPPVLVFAVRADQLLINAWGPVVKNLTHIARHPGARFVTVNEAAALVDERPSRVVPVGAAA
jgi:hypothetical protein